MTHIKPQTAAAYNKSHVEHVRRTCLYFATRLGDFLDDLVVVGGLVPTLLIEQNREDIEKHVGTMDLDIGLTVALLDDKRYQTLSERLRQAGFGPDVNSTGRQTRQRWQIEGPPKVTIDFLIPPSREGDRGGDLRHIESDFAAFIAPGLRLAFQDRVKINLSGRTILDEPAERNIWVCGPGAFILMKSLAFRSRTANKDAYDLAYVLQQHGSGIEVIAASIRPLMAEKEVQEALEFLTKDFETPDSLGPRCVARFRFGRLDENAQADAWGAVQDLLGYLR